MPPTAEEESFLRDTAVLQSEKEAEEVIKVAPSYGEGNKLLVDGKVDKGKGKETEPSGKPVEKKGWFGWGK